MYKQFTNKQIIPLQINTKINVHWRYVVTCLVIRYQIVIRYEWLRTYLFHLKLVIIKQFTIYIQFCTKFYVEKFQQMKRFDELKFSKMIVSCAYETC